MKTSLLKILARKKHAHGGPLGSLMRIEWNPRRCAETEFGPRATREMHSQCSARRIDVVAVFRSVGCCPRSRRARHHQRVRDSGAVSGPTWAAARTSPLSARHAPSQLFSTASRQTHIPNFYHETCPPKVIHIFNTKHHRLTCKKKICIDATHLLRIS